jgi:hypothetical protein
MLVTKKSLLVLLLAAAVAILLTPQAPRLLAAQSSALSQIAQIPAPDARLSSTTSTPTNSTPHPRTGIQNKQVVLRAQLIAQ